jgi:DNA-binding IclR family transcriptional regulator
MSPDSPEKPRSGTQAIERAAHLLRELALHGAFGWRASELAAHCGLDRGTTQRLLACLTRERLAQQRPSDRRYLPGPLLFELGLSVPGMHGLQAIAASAVSRAASRLNAVSSLYLRSGEDIVCAARHGSTTIKALTSEVGTRRPAVMSVGGVAILLALPEPLRADIIERGLARARRQGEARLRAVRQMLSESELAGYAVNAGQVVPGVHAFAVALRKPAGDAFASLAIAGPANVLPLEQAASIIGILNEEARAIEHEAIRRWPPQLTM